MEVGIYNSVNSLFLNHRDINVLWTSVLIADKIKYSGIFTAIYWLNIMFHNCKTEEQRVAAAIKTFPLMYDNLNLNVEKYIDDLNLVYKTVKSLRKERNKPKQLIITLMEGEKLLKTTFKNVADYLSKFLANTTISHLKPHINTNNGDEFITFLDDCDYAIKVFASDFFPTLETYFTDSDKFIIYDNSLETVELNSDENRHVYSSVDLFDVPAFQYLNEPQYMEFRKAFLPGNDVFRSVMSGLKKEICDMDYSDENVRVVQKSAEEQFSECRQDLQNRFNDCIVRCTDIPENSVKNKLCLGFTSRDRFLRLNSRAKIFADDVYPYVKEHLEGVMDLNKMMAFLFVRF